MTSGRLKDFLYGVKKLKLKHLSNGYISGGTYVVLLGFNRGNDHEKLLIDGRKMDLMETKEWKYLRNKVVNRLGGKWRLLVIEQPLYIQLEVDVDDFKKKFPDSKDSII
jgi:hypothetical protein